MFNQLHSISNQELFEKHLCNPHIPKERNGTLCPRYTVQYINDRLKSEVSIMLHCQLCSTCYTAVQIKNCSKSTPVIKIATMKNTDGFYYEGKPSHATTKLTLFTVETQRRRLVGPRRMHCMCCSMPKGTSRAKATSNSEKINPIVLAVVELCLCLMASVSYSVSQ